MNAHSGVTSKNLGNERAWWMMALTRDLYVFAPGVTASVSTILFSICDFAQARNVRAFPSLLIFHDNSFNRYRRT
jgi:hypothetical protein